MLLRLPRWLLRRLARLALGLIGLALTGLAAVLLVLVLRLAAGPLVLPVPPEDVAALLAGPLDGLQVRAGRAVVSWSPARALIDITVEDTTLLPPPGAGAARPLGRFDRLSLGFALSDLMAGRAVPYRLHLDGARLRLVRAADGALLVGVGEVPLSALVGPAAPPPAEAEGPPLTPAEALLRRLAALGRQRPLQMAVTAARLDVEDRLAARTRSGRLAVESLTLTSRGGTVLMTAALSGRLGAAAAGLGLEMAHDDEGTRLVARLDGLEAARLAGLDPELAALGAADLAITGRAEAQLDRGFHLEAAAAELTLSGGTFTVAPAGFDAPVPIAGAWLNGSWDGREGRVRLRVDLGEPQILAELAITEGTAGLTAMGEAVIRTMPPRALATYWPPVVAPNARRWILANVTGGIIEEARVEVALAAAPRLDTLEVSALDGSLRFRDLTIRYWDPMPPAVGVSGQARVTRQRIDMTVAGGRILDVEAGEGTVTITGLDSGEAGGERLAVSVPLSGPLPTILGIIDRPPLGYASRLGLAPNSTRGAVEARLDVAFPLLLDLPIERLDIDVAGTGRRVAIPGAVGRLDLTDGVAEVRVDKEGMDVRGTGAIDGIPLRFDWRENFTADAEINSRISATGRVEEADLVRLGVDLRPWLKGPVTGALTYVSPAAGPARLEVTGDLVGAQIRSEELGYLKPIGAPGRAELAFTLEDGVFRAIESGRVTAAGLDLSLAARFDVTGAALASITVPRLIAGAHDVSAEAVPLAGGGWRVVVRGQRLDLRPLLGFAPPLPPSAFPPEPPRPDLPLDLDVAVAQAILSDAGGVNALRGRAVADPLGWVSLEFQAGGAAEAARLTIVRAAGGSHGLVIDAADAGAALSALDVYGSVRGGRLLVEGVIDRFEPRMAVRGGALLTDFTLVEAPMVTRVLNAMSLVGLIELFSRDGLAFDRLQTAFRQDGELWAFEDGRAAGPGVGFTFGGRIDAGSGRMDIAGVTVPAYFVNQVLGEIPLLGRLLTGGEGLFAAQYRLHGPLTAPQVEVNALSALAPGFLRDLFFEDAPESVMPAPLPAPR